jgi:hypothetical protein
MNADRKQGYFFQKVRIHPRLSTAAKVFQQTPSAVRQESCPMRKIDLVDLEVAPS